jgi:hypothetical protein
LPPPDQPSKDRNGAELPERQLRAILTLNAMNLRGITLRDTAFSCVTMIHIVLPGCAQIHCGARVFEAASP